MQLWSRNTTAQGLVTAMVGPATVPRLAPALDPNVDHVLLSQHNPVTGTGTGWTPALLPLTAESALQPVRLRIARLRYDVLFATRDFLQAVHQLDRFGATVRQFTKAPRADVDFDDPRPAVRTARYRAFGLSLGIDLPHPGEQALLVARTDDLLDGALRRLGLPVIVAPSHPG